LFFIASQGSSVSASRNTHRSLAARSQQIFLRLREPLKSSDRVLVFSLGVSVPRPRTLSRAGLPPLVFLASTSSPANFSVAVRRFRSRLLVDCCRLMSVHS
jgi:hypothetical protein